MKKNNTLKRGLIAVMAILGLTLSVLPVSGEETESSTTDLPVIELDMQDASPLETLKETLIHQRAETIGLDLSTVDLEASTIRVDHFDQTQKGLSQVNASVTLVSSDKTEEDESDTVVEPTVTLQFTQTVIVHIKESKYPQLFLSEDAIELYVDDEFDPMSYIGYISDSSKILPAVSIENWVDPSTAGTYWCHYKAVNQLGKETSAYLRVDVADKPVTTSTGVTVNLGSITAGIDGSVYGMLEAINAVRAEYGLYAYSMADQAGLTAAAVRATEASYYLSHSRPNGTPYYTAFDEQGVGHGAMYEILVAYGSSIESNLAWWLSEPGHARIVLGSAGSTIAIGYANGVWSADVY